MSFVWISFWKQTKWSSVKEFFFSIKEHYECRYPIQVITLQMSTSRFFKYRNKCCCWIETLRMLTFGSRFWMLITDVNFKIHYYGCRHPVHVFELWMTTFGSRFWIVDGDIRFMFLNCRWWHSIHVFECLLRMSI